MKKVTKDYLLRYVENVGNFEKEHRKYSSFYCWCTHVITQEDIDSIKKDEEMDASDFLNVEVSLSGQWSDSDGTDWFDEEFQKVEGYEELVPEVVIPEHYVTKVKKSKFTPNFSEE